MASPAVGDTATDLAGLRAEKLVEVGRWLEGPCWVPSRQAVLFSDIPGNRVMEYLPSTGELRVVEAEAEFTNGRALDRDGTVVECSHGRRAVQRRDGDQISVLVDHWEGRRLNSPNDVVVDSSGVIWFTDPSYGIDKPDEGHPGEREYRDRWVFGFDPSSGEIVPAITDVVAPNGLAFSPDESLLYVADSSGADETGHGSDIRVYDVLEGRRCKDGRVFTTITAGVPDGIRVDDLGRVWSSAADGVHVFDPDGTEVGFVAVPETVSNLCFAPSLGADAGDRSAAGVVYLTATTSLYRIPLALN